MFFIAENFAQKLEIKDLAGEPLSPISMSPFPLSSPPSRHKPARLAAPADAVAKATEVHVLQSGTASEVVSTSEHTIDRTLGGNVANKYSTSEVEDESVVDDGQFDMLIPESQIENGATKIQDVQTATILPPAEDIQVIASSIEAETQTGQQPTVTTSSSEQRVDHQDSSTSGNEVEHLSASEKEDGSDGTSRSLYSSIAVRLDHPYSGSPWRKTTEEAETPQERDEVEQCQESHEEHPSSPQKGRRSRRKGPTKKLTSGSPTSTPGSSDEGSSPRKRKLGVTTRGASAKAAQQSSETEQSPPAKRTRRAAAGSTRSPQEPAGGDNETSQKHPLEWGMEEVRDFISNIPHCDHTIFVEHVS